VRISRKEFSLCHAAHVQRWRIGALVWIWWGCQGWRPAVVVGHTRCYVKVECRDSHMNLPKKAKASANRLVARRRGQAPPRRSGAVLPNCLVASAARGGNVEQMVANL
jgi:hypothetical protein